jgi:hypothetical protein
VQEGENSIVMGPQRLGDNGLGNQTNQRQKRRKKKFIKIPFL